MKKISVNKLEKLIYQIMKIEAKERGYKLSAEQNLYKKEEEFALLAGLSYLEIEKYEDAVRCFSSEKMGLSHKLRNCWSLSIFTIWKKLFYKKVPYICF